VIILSTKDESPLSDPLWVGLAFSVDACIPDAKRQEVDEKIANHEANLWKMVWVEVIGKVVGNTIIFAIGFAVHTFFV